MKLDSPTRLHGSLNMYMYPVYEENMHVYVCLAFAI